MRKRELYPSLLSADFSKLGEECRALEALGVTRLHLDVMDGSYVPPISFGEHLLASLRRNTSLFFDAHLMTVHPETHIDDMKKSGVQCMTVHAEACLHLDRTLHAIRDAGMEAGVALNPATPLSALEYVLDKADQILLMTVNPGYGGQKFIPGMLGKIADLRKMLDDRGYTELPIQVDGGIYTGNVAEITAAGADRIVSGSGVFSGNMEENVKTFLEIL